jgi:hypothetical protein
MKAYARLGVSQVWVGPGPTVEDPAGWVGELTEHVLPRLSDL